MQNNAFDMLYQNRLMRNNWEIESFENALKEARILPNANYILKLYDAFDDKTEHSEVMWGLIHLIESFDDIYGYQKTLESLAKATPNILVNAKEWAKIIYYRLLNNEPSRIAFKKVLKETGKKTKTQIVCFLNEIKEDDTLRFGESIVFVLSP